MSHSYSADLRMRVIAAIWEGLSTRKAAARFDIGVATAGRWWRTLPCRRSPRALENDDLHRWIAP